MRAIISRAPRANAARWLVACLVAHYGDGDIIIAARRIGVAATTLAELPARTRIQPRTVRAMQRAYDAMPQQLCLRCGPFDEAFA